MQGPIISSPEHAQPLDPIVFKLRARDQNDPLKNSKLINNIREEEAFNAAKSQRPKTFKGHKLSMATYPTQVSGDAETDLEVGPSTSMDVLT